jgi:hypothetical protein
MNIDTFAMMLKIVQESMQELGIHSVHIDTQNKGAFIVNEDNFDKIHGETIELVSVDKQYKRVSRMINDVEFYTYKKEIRATKDTDKNENTHTNTTTSEVA